MIVALETCKALLRAAEADADANHFGVVTPAWAPLNAAPQLVPADLPALHRDPAPARRQRPDGAADRGRRVRPGRGRHRELPPVRRRSTARSASGCSAWPGTRACRRSPDGSRSTSTSSSATLSGWRARSSRATTASLQRARARVPAPRREEWVMAGDGNGAPLAADVVVVGSGSAGAVIARRLVDAGAGVVLLEAGGPDVNPAIHDPSRALRAVGQRAGLGLPHGPPGSVRQPRAAMAARKGARRIERAERDDLRARASQRLRHLGVPGQRRVGLRRRAAAVQAVGGLRSGRERVPRGRRAAARAVAATSRTRSTPRSSTPPRRPGSRSTTTTTASSSTASASPAQRSRTACARAWRRPSCAPVADAPNLDDPDRERARGG